MSNKQYTQVSLEHIHITLVNDEKISGKRFNIDCYRNLLTIVSSLFSKNLLDFIWTSINDIETTVTLRVFLLLYK